jgi:hypothetical protein
MPITDVDYLCDGLQMDFWTKLAFSVGLLLTLISLMLRMYDFIDNSTTLPFFVIGVIIVVIGEGNRVRLEENPVSAH